MKGWIYQIVQIKSDDIPYYEGMCYIGQHRNSPLKKRWQKHKNDAKKYDPTKKGRGSKFAKLHQSMQTLGGVDYFELKEIESFEHSDENKLIDLLNEAENKYIDQFDSKKNGWNKVYAPKTNSRRYSAEKSLAQEAYDNQVSYTSLLYRVNKVGEKVEEAIKHLKNNANKPTEKYEYKRQTFNNIREISKSKLHNKNDLDKKTIERKIRELKQSNKLKIKINKENNQKIYVLVDEIFNAVKQRNVYTVITPEGDELSGLIIDLHKILLKRFPNEVPEKYTTVQGRIKKDNWDVQQAFGFEYPPDLIEIKPLVKKGYKFAIGKPDFRKTANYKPVVFHSTQEIFVSQKEFSEAFGFKDYEVSEILKTGKTPEEVRDIIWGKNK